MNEISISYPNPILDRLYLMGDDRLVYKIYDFTGTLLIDGEYYNQSGIDVSRLSLGLYLIKTE